MNRVTRLFEGNRFLIRETFLDDEFHGKSCFLHALFAVNDGSAVRKDWQGSALTVNETTWKERKQKIPRIERRFRDIAL